MSKLEKLYNQLCEEKVCTELQRDRNSVTCTIVLIIGMLFVLFAITIYIFSRICERQTYTTIAYWVTTIVFIILLIIALYTLFDTWCPFLKWNREIRDEF